MKYQVAILDLAQKDLQEIHEYLSEFGENIRIKYV